MVSTSSDGVYVSLLAEGCAYDGRWLLLRFSFYYTRWAQGLGGNAGKDADPQRGRPQVHLLDSSAYSEGGKDADPIAGGHKGQYISNRDKGCGLG